MLDTLLVVRGETARRFALAIGVDVPHPGRRGNGAVGIRRSSISTTGPPPRNPSGWFFHVGAKNIVATHWEPLFDESGEAAEAAPNGSPAIKGFRTRLLEISGQAGRVPPAHSRG